MLDERERPKPRRRTHKNGALAPALLTPGTANYNDEINQLFKNPLLPVSPSDLSEAREAFPDITESLTKQIIRFESDRPVIRDTLDGEIRTPLESLEQVHRTVSRFPRANGRLYHLRRDYTQAIGRRFAHEANKVSAKAASRSMTHGEQETLEHLSALRSELMGANSSEATRYLTDLHDLRDNMPPIDPEAPIATNSVIDRYRRCERIVTANMNSAITDIVAASLIRGIPGMDHQFGPVREAQDAISFAFDTFAQHNDFIPAARLLNQIEDKLDGSPLAASLYKDIYLGNASHVVRMMMANGFLRPAESMFEDWVEAAHLIGKLKDLMQIEIDKVHVDPRLLEDISLMDRLRYMAEVSLPVRLRKAINPANSQQLEQRSRWVVRTVGNTVSALANFNGTNQSTVAEVLPYWVEEGQPKDILDTIYKSDRRTGIGALEQMYKEIFPNNGERLTAQEEALVDMRYRVATNGVPWLIEIIQSGHVLSNEQDFYRLYRLLLDFCTEPITQDPIYAKATSSVTDVLAATPRILIAQNTNKAIQLGIYVQDFLTGLALTPEDDKIMQSVATFALPKSAKTGTGNAPSVIHDSEFGVIVPHLIHELAKKSTSELPKVFETLSTGNLARKMNENETPLALYVAEKYLDIVSSPDIPYAENFQRMTEFGTLISSVVPAMIEADRLPQVFKFMTKWNESNIAFIDRHTQARGDVREPIDPETAPLLIQIDKEFFNVVHSLLTLIPLPTSESTPEYKSEYYTLAYYFIGNAMTRYRDQQPTFAYALKLVDALVEKQIDANPTPYSHAEAPFSLEALELSRRKIWDYWQLVKEEQPIDHPDSSVTPEQEFDNYSIRLTRAIHGVLNLTPRSERATELLFDLVKNSTGLVVTPSILNNVAYYADKDGLLTKDTTLYLINKSCDELPQLVESWMEVQDGDKQLLRAIITNSLQALMILKNAAVDLEAYDEIDEIRTNISAKQRVHNTLLSIVKTLRSRSDTRTFFTENKAVVMHNNEPSVTELMNEVVGGKIS